MARSYFSRLTGSCSPGQVTSRQHRKSGPGTELLIKSQPDTSTDSLATIPPCARSKVDHRHRRVSFSRSLTVMAERRGVHSPSGREHQYCGTARLSIRWAASLSEYGRSIKVKFR